MGLDPEKQRAVADNLIDKIRIIDTTCVVAGGCVRDWFRGVSAKDIDLFMYDGGESASKNKERLEKLLGIELKVLSKEYTGSVTDNHISGVFEGIYQNQLINIIAWKRKTFNVTQTFPAYNVKMHYLPELGNNKSRWVDSLLGFSYLYCKEIYVTEDINTKYWEKLKSKFPDCKIILVGQNGKALPPLKGDIHKALDMISDLGCPTDAEIETVSMVLPGTDLRSSWISGMDITDEKDFVIRNTEERKGKISKTVMGSDIIPW